MAESEPVAGTASPYLPAARGGVAERLTRWKFAAAYRVWRRVIRRYGSPGGTGRILEVGAGPGNFAACLERWFPDSKLTALDLEDELVRYAAARVPSAAFIRASSERIPLASNTFEIVSALQVIEHFESPENFLSEVARVLRPGGLFLMATPNTRGIGARLRGDAWQGIRDDHVSLREPAEWRKALSSSGFECLSDGTTLFNGLPVIGRPPFSLPFLALQSAAGWFPWELGESYMAVARLKA
ncbi:MAG: class I SAM-dependent methyltransferase [Myxococcota bacterium]|nr:class I SAM-dependent methyltransferase [Myxococcota bacterium]